MNSSSLKILFRLENKFWAI